MAQCRGPRQLLRRQALLIIGGICEERKFLLHSYLTMARVPSFVSGLGGGFYIEVFDREYLGSNRNL